MPTPTDIPSHAGIALLLCAAIGSALAFVVAYFLAAPLAQYALGRSSPDYERAVALAEMAVIVVGACVQIAFFRTMRARYYRALPPPPV